MVVVADVAVTFGTAFTATATVAVFVQPLAAVPVTVYVVFPVGATVTLFPVRLPGIQLYVLAPPPVSVVDCPLQMVAVADDAVTVGLAFTVIVRVAVLVQPLAAVPVTV